MKGNFVHKYPFIHVCPLLIQSSLGSTPTLGAVLGAEESAANKTHRSCQDAVCLLGERRRLTINNQPMNGMTLGFGQPHVVDTI